MNCRPILARLFSGVQSVKAVKAALYGGVALGVLAAPCRAEWGLDHYEYSQRVVWHSIHVDKGMRPPIDIHHQMTPEQEVQSGTKPASHSFGAISSVSVRVRKATYEPPALRIRLSVTPVYKWWGGGKPSTEFFTREYSHLGQFSMHRKMDATKDQYYPYSQEQPYEGGKVSVTAANNGFEPVSLRETTIRGYQYAAGATEGQWSQLSGYKDQWYVKKWAVGEGQTTFQGQTRQLTATVELAALEAGDIEETLGASLYAYYRAEVCRFSLDVGTDLIEDFSLHPRERQLQAYANKNWTHRNDVDYASDFFWDGYAGYSANLSENLLAEIGNPTYTWTVKGAYGEGVISPGRLDIGAYQYQHIMDEGTVAPSTRVKSFHHNVGVKESGQWKFPQSTLTRVIISGDKPGGEILRAKADITWYEKPKTSYATETVFEVIDLDTGAVTSVAAELSVLPEEADIDAYIAEIEAAEDGFFEGYTTILQTGTDVGMMMIEVVAPDPVDILTLGAGKVYKTIKAVRVLARVGSAVNKVGGLMHDAVKARRKANGQSENVVLRATSRAFESARLGKLPPGASRADEVDPDSGKPVRRFFGPSCFVAGTPVALADGTTKAIEQIKVGDRVLSKDESSGEVAAKQVTHTFERQADATLLLTFAGGEQIETTAEHPFYVEGKGFTPAGLLAIGNSIVTRAGPALAIEKIEKKNEAQTVYNLTVEGFHTYFVGKAKLWVHNISCNAINAAKNKANNLLDIVEENRPSTTCAIEVPGHSPFVGHSSFQQESVEAWWARQDDRVKELFDQIKRDFEAADIPVRGWHGYCAEVDVLSQILGSGINPSGAKSVAIQVGRTGKVHGRPKPACDSCAEAFRRLGITDDYNVAINLEDVGG